MDTIRSRTKKNMPPYQYTCEIFKLPQVGILCGFYYKDGSIKRTGFKIFKRFLLNVLYNLKISHKPLNVQFSIKPSGFVQLDKIS